MRRDEMERREREKRERGRKSGLVGLSAMLEGEKREEGRRGGEGRRERVSNKPRN